MERFVFAGVIVSLILGLIYGILTIAEHQILQRMKATETGRGLCHYICVICVITDQLSKLQIKL